MTLINYFVRNNCTQFERPAIRAWDWLIDTQLQCVYSALDILFIMDSHLSHPIP